MFNDHIYIDFIIKRYEGSYLLDIYQGDISNITDVFRGSFPRSGIRVSSVSYKIYKYRNKKSILKDYFESDNSYILYKVNDLYKGLNVFNFIDFLNKAEEFYLYTFEGYNERVVNINLDYVLNLVSKVKQVEFKYYRKGYLSLPSFNVNINEATKFVLEDYVVFKVIDKYIYSNTIFPYFDIHLFLVKGSKVMDFYIFTHHCNISEDKKACWDKLQPYDFVNFDFNYDSSYHKYITYSFKVNKKLILEFIDKMKIKI